MGGAIPLFPFMLSWCGEGQPFLLLILRWPRGKVTCHTQPAHRPIYGKTTINFNQMLFDSPLTCLLTRLSYGVMYLISSTQVLDPHLKSSITECSQPITTQTDAHYALGRPEVPSRLNSWFRIQALLPSIIFYLNTQFSPITIVATPT